MVKKIKNQTNQKNKRKTTLETICFFIHVLEMSIPLLNKQFAKIELFSQSIYKN